MLNRIISVSSFFWAYGKLLAYIEQEKPFVHIDNDVFLWHPLPKDILNAELCFQSKEYFTQKGYLYYNYLKRPWMEAPVQPIPIKMNPVSDFAYNCGICGGNNLDFFKEWIRCSRQYIFAKANQDVFFNRHAGLLIHQNLFHEQYFAACLIKKYGMRKKVKVLADDAMDINKGYPPEKPRYTHLWGTTKKSIKYMERVKKALYFRDPKLHNRVKAFCTNNNV